jgi:hypothetical protein
VPRCLLPKISDISSLSSSLVFGGHTMSFSML